MSNLEINTSKLFDKYVIQRFEKSPFLQDCFRKQHKLDDLHKIIYRRLTIMFLLGDTYKQLYVELDLKSKALKAIEKVGLQYWEKMQDNRVHSKHNNFAVHKIEDKLDFQAKIYAQCIFAYMQNLKKK
jgi:hypothetical protein